MQKTVPFLPNQEKSNSDDSDYTGNSLSNRKNKEINMEPKETFTTAQIRRLNDVVEQIFPPDVIPEVIEMSFDIKNKTLDEARKN